MKKLLIIEDDVVLLTELTAKFNLAGFEVYAFDGTETVGEIADYIHIEKPDYIILDLILPKISGYDLLHSIKGDENTFNVPLIVFSDFSEEDVRIRCQNLGADYYFVKQDFMMDDFVAKIKRIVNNRTRNNS